MRGGRASWRLLVSLVLVLGGLVAGIGLPAGVLADTTYTSCPSYSTFQSGVQNATGTVTFTFPANCAYTPASGVTSTITIPAAANVTIDGNGLSITAGTASSPGSFAIFTVAQSAALTLDHATLADGNNGIGYTGLGGDVTLTNVTITGSGADGLTGRTTISLTDSTISGSSADGISGVLANVTLTNTMVSNSASDGIAVIGKLTLTGSTVSSSGGKGIGANGTVTLANSTVSDSGGDGVDASQAASLTGSAISNSHGNGIVDSSDVTLIDSTISESTAYGISAGGNVSLTNSAVTGSGDSGVYASGGTATLMNSTVSGSGGAGVIATDTATLTNSTVAGSAGNGVSALGGATLTNSTVSGSGSYGVFTQGNLTLTFATVIGNDTGIYLPGDLTVTATLLAENQGNDCAHGPLTDKGYNLADDNSCGFSALGSRNNVSDAQLALGPLGNYGGPTETIPLEVGSLAVGAIPVNSSRLCLDANSNVITDPTTGSPITTDQRGVSRPQGARCDIGAFEWSLPASTPNTVVEVLTQGNPAIRAQLFTSASGMPLGYLTYVSTQVRFRFLLVESVVQTGPNQGTLYGTGVLTSGQAVTWQIDLHGNPPKTVQLRLSTGYDSGPLPVYGIVGVTNTGQ